MRRETRLLRNLSIILGLLDVMMVILILIYAKDSNSIPDNAQATVIPVYTATVTPNIYHEPGESIENVPSSTDTASRPQSTISAMPTIAPSVIPDIAEETIENTEAHISFHDSCASLQASSVINIDGRTTDDIKSCFYSADISDDIFNRINGLSYGSECAIPLEDLQYVRLLHYGFDDKVHIGELIVNKSISKDICSIFYDLFLERYPIEKMLLVDEYLADDDASMEDNNTSCFNFRLIAGTSSYSNHAYGLAIDINPLYNPYVRETKNGLVISPSTGQPYIDRTADCPYYIKEGDVCWEIFMFYGFDWGGGWMNPKDYQHFEKSAE